MDLASFHNLNKLGIIRKNAPVAQLDRVLVSEAKGREFDKFAWSEFEQRSEAGPEGGGLHGRRP